MCEQCCWWCTLKITDEVCSLPYDYDDRRRKFNMIGQFCSWECVKSYNLHENKHKFGQIQNNITLYRTKKYGKKFMSLKCAPSRYTLKKFGGTFTEEEFRSNFSARPPVITTPETEFFLHNVVIREDDTYSAKTSKTKAQRMQDIKSSTSKADTLKLKRPTPVKRNDNNIENALNLIRKPRGT